MNDNTSPESLRANYRDMSDEQLAVLQLDRADLTEVAREVLDAELKYRGLDVEPRVAELLRERFDNYLTRWNDDDFLQYLRGGPALQPWQREVVREQLLRRDMDARTFLGATELQGQEPLMTGPFASQEVLPPGQTEGPE
jgi:hypothetical protein